MVALLLLCRLAGSLLVAADDSSWIDMSEATPGKFSLGGNLWPSAELPKPVWQAKMGFLRLWIDNGLSSDEAPVNVTDAQADAWANATVAKNDGLATFKSFATEAARGGMQILLGGSSFGQPYMLPTGVRVFDPARTRDAATIWAAVVARMAALDCLALPPAFIELSNEPNGNWDAYLPPLVWARLACAVRAALDARGLQSVGISGPGVSLGSSAPYLEALKTTGSLKCVALISVHTWEDPSSTNGPHEMAGMLSEYEVLRNKFDPDHSKVWAATEFGSRVDSIGGKKYSHPVSNCYDVQYKQKTLPPDAEILDPRYATRVAAFTLLHMNSHFDAALYWWVSDYDWSPLCFGLNSRNGSATPTLRMFRELFMLPGFELPRLHPISRNWTDNDTVTGAAVSTDRERAVIWLVHAPSDGQAMLRRTISVTGLEAAVTLRGHACFPDSSSCTVMQPQAALGLKISVVLMPNAAVAITFAKSRDAGSLLNMSQELIV